MKINLPIVLITVFVALCLGGIFFWQPQIAVFILIGLLIGIFISLLFVRQNRLDNGKIELAGSAPKKNQTNAEIVSPRALLGTIINAAHDAIIAIDADFRVIAANAAAGDIFMNASTPLETKRLAELTRNLSVHDAFQTAIERGEYTEVKIESRGNERRNFHLRVAPLEFAEEKDTRQIAVGIFYETTQMERLERVRQEFLSNVSHELRTPLTSILAFVETLESGAINDAENNMRFLGVIRKNAERMHRLINDILELSAIESGKIIIEPNFVKLSILVEEIKTNLETKAENRKIEIKNKIHPEIKVYGDRFRLEQMLTNLMDNAIKFNRENGLVTIDFDTDGTHDRVRVSDTGEGLAPEHVERLFERFYRVDRARSREYGGTGLGLAIVKHLARLHGGEASVTSKLGEGSTFIIEIPSVSASAKAKS